MQRNHKVTNSIIIIFTKVPSPGFVKTRLTLNSNITIEDASDLAEAMLKDTIVLASESDSESIGMGFTPDNKQSKLKELIDNVNSQEIKSKNLFYFSQSGSNFDERFESVIKKASKEKFKNFIVLGADLPYLDPKLINHSLDILSKNEKERILIIGPASGGGIYLLGFTENFNPAWFTNYNLFRGGIEIFQFIKICNIENIRLMLLPPLIDIDIEEDLVSLITFIEALRTAENSNYYHYPKFTEEVIRNLGFKIKDSPDETRKRKIFKSL